MKFICLTLFCFCIFYVTEARAQQPVTLVTLGDSLTETSGGDGIEWEYPRQLLSMIQDIQSNSILHNLAVSGWNSDELIDGQLGQGETLLNQAIAAGHMGIVNVWIGSNDLWGLYEWKCDDPLPPQCETDDLQNFTNNIDTILSRLSATGAKVFIALGDDQSRRPVVSDPSYPGYPSILPDELPLMSEQVKRYNEVIQTKATQYGATTVDFYNTTIFEMPETLSEDGDHPNDVGYNAIATIWFNAIRPEIVGGTSSSSGYMVTSDLWIRAVINTVEKGPVDAVWKKGGEATTSRGDRVIWGHFYASPSDVTWGSQNNPDLFVKIWFDVSGRIDVNYFHVSVPDIEVYSDYPFNGTYNEHGTTTMSRRYIRQYYEGGQSHSEENFEDGLPVGGYSQVNNPSGYTTINNLRIGSMINTVEKGSIEAVWRLGGQDTTARGDQVVWGHYYASPSDVSWGSQDNPDLYVKSF
jgi:lysophospholipase L1-like esterase